MPQPTDIDILLDFFVQLVESQAGKKILPENEWLNDVQVLSLKIFRHLVSIQKLSQPSHLRRGSQEIVFIDHSSVQVVARAALETYLVLHYVFKDSDKLLCQFRYKTWKLGGLSERQKFHLSTDESKAVQLEEKSIIDSLKIDISASPYFEAYSERNKQRVLEGDWKAGKQWIDLATQAGFHKKYFRDIYGYLCGYSHSSYASAMQVGGAKTVEDQKFLTNMIQTFCMVIMSHFAMTYVSIFESSANILSENHTAMRIVDRWRFQSDDLKIIYGPE